MANALKYQFSPEEAMEALYKRGLMDGTGRGFLQTLIDEMVLIDENQFFWQEHFRIDGNEYDIDRSDLKKSPAWTVRQKINRTVPMADAMAPLSETMQLDAEGFGEKTGSIYQYGKGLYETSMSKMELAEKLQELGPDRDLVVGYVRGVADLVKTHNLTASNMAAQTLSRGGEYGNIVNLGTQETPLYTKGFSGVQTYQQPYIPATNFKKAGAKVWSANDADIPEQMRKIEEDFKAANGVASNVRFRWDIPYDIVTNVLMRNAAFLKEVNMWVAKYGSSNNRIVIIKPDGSSEGMASVTYEDLLAYTRSEISKVSPIFVVREKQTVQGLTSYYDVEGWKKGIAVLRPAGYAGVLVHAKTPDEELMQRGELNVLSFNSARVQTFLYVMNTVVPDGKLKAYHVDVLGRYATVLSESPYHVVVDTTQADN